MAKDKGSIFYVYKLFRLDGSVCYVGKGKGNCWKNSATGNISHVNHKLIALVKLAGGELPAAFVQSDLSEKEAYALEIKLIAEYGREPDGLLVNLTDGGEGGEGGIRWNSESHPEAAEAIRVATLAFWEKRRKQGLPLTHRSKEGNRKHSQTIRARWAVKTPEERRPKEINSHMYVVTLNGETTYIEKLARRHGVGSRSIKKRLERGLSVEEALSEAMKWSAEFYRNSNRHRSRRNGAFVKSQL